MATGKSAHITHARNSPRQPLRLTDALALVVVAALLFLVYYVHCSQMGLYEDDWVNPANGINSTWQQAWSTLRQMAVDWPRARPLGNAGAFFFPFVLYQVFGFTGVYLLPFAVVMVNSALLYVLVRRQLGRFPAFVSAVTFALLPTDNMRLTLHATTENQGAVFFLLLGILAYGSARRWLCPFAIALSILCQESAVPTFFFIPLLYEMPSREAWKRWAAHIAGCLTGIAVPIAVRVFVMADVRTRSAVQSPWWVIERGLTSVFYGVRTHLFLLRARLFSPELRNTAGAPGAAAAIASSVFAAYVYWQREVAARTLDRIANPLVRLALFGALAFAVPYFAYVTDPYWPAVHRSGRIASVHIASGVGVALLGGAGAAAFTSIRRRRLAAAFAALLSVYLGLMLAYGVFIAAQYQQAWTNQRTFWRALMPQLGDITDSTLIFVDNKDQKAFPFTWAILSNSWADSIVLRKIFVFPAEWRRDPRVFNLTGEWENGIRCQGGEFLWEMPAGEWNPQVVRLEPGNVIVVRSVAGVPMRTSDPVLRLACGDLPLRLQERPGTPAFPHKEMYKYLLE